MAQTQSSQQHTAQVHAPSEVSLAGMTSCSALQEYNSEHFNTCGRTIKTGLIAVDIVSHWTWYVCNAPSFLLLPMMRINACHSFMKCRGIVCATLLMSCVQALAGRPHCCRAVTWHISMASAGPSGMLFHALILSHTTPYANPELPELPVGFLSTKFAIMLVDEFVENCALTYEHAANFMSGRALNSACTAGTLLGQPYRSCCLASWQLRSSAKHPLLTPCRRLCEHAGARWPTL